MLMLTLSFTNIKGGVTKTTCVVNFGHALAQMGYKVLIIDTDPQCNATYTITGKINEEIDGTLYEVLKEDKPLKDIIVPTHTKNLDLAPATMWLCAIEIELASRQGREWILKRAIKNLDTYDFVLIDTMPFLGLLTLNAWAASTDLIVPVTLTVYALVGIKILEWSLNQARRNLEIPLPIMGVIASLADNTVNSQKRLSEVRSYFGDFVFDTAIPRNIKVEEAKDRSESLFEYAPESAGAESYRKLVKEVLQRVEQKKT